MRKLTKDTKLPACSTLSTTASAPCTTMHQHHEVDHDLFVFEHVFQLKFWIIGGSLVSWWISNVLLMGQQARAISNSLHGRDLLYQRLTQPLVPHIASRLRRNILLLIHVGILCLQTVEGYWIIVTLARFSNGLWQDWPNYRQGGFSASAAYLSSIVLTILLGFWLVIFGAVMVVFQLAYVGELIVMTSWLRR